MLEAMRIGLWLSPDIALSLCLEDAANDSPREDGAGDGIMFAMYCRASSGRLMRESREIDLGGDNELGAGESGRLGAGLDSGLLASREE